MPWTRTDVNERAGEVRGSGGGRRKRWRALCREFGISRPTGYRWRNRFQSGGSLDAAVLETEPAAAAQSAQTDPAKEGE